MALATRPEKPSTLRSIIAGSTAGAVEIAITFPAEYAKTVSQLNRALPSGKKVPLPPFGRQWYAGCTTLIIGNSLKAGVRFVAFDHFRALLADDQGHISGSRTVLAGLLAGTTESVLAVTPFESIKTTLIDDRKSARPQLTGFVSGTSHILRTRGVPGLFAGFVPTTLRQASNSAVRFGTYNALKQLASSYVAPGEKLGGASTFGIGAAAGIVTVAVTQPLDTVKTRLQSLKGKSEYGGMVGCSVRIAREEGWRAFWSGAMPRAVRLMLSGGIVFTMYEKMMEGMDRVDPERRYI